MLNNDIEAEPAWLAELVAALDRHPEAGLATSRIMLYDRRDILNSAGDLYRRDGMPDSRGVWQPYGPPYDQERWSLAAGAARWRCVAPCWTRSGFSRKPFSCTARMWT